MAGEAYKTVGVITGDIVLSSKIEARAELLKQLEDVFAIARENISTDMDFEIYRGDSFQGVAAEAHKALRTALLIRARLMMHHWDTRVAIGIGAAQYAGKSISSSDGDAFHYSGRLLDEMEAKKRRLDIETPWPEINEELKVHAVTLDAIMHKLSQKDAETLYHALLENETQQNLAEKLNISQPAVHKRLQHAMWPVIETIINRFEKLIYTHTGHE